MQKIYYQFILFMLVLTTLGFGVWLVAGIENAREMLFVITVLSACVAAKQAMNKVKALYVTDAD
jgi:hypothetical protein